MNNVTNVFPVKLVAVIWSPICSWSLKCSIALYKISFSLNYNPFLICPFVFPMLFLSLLVFFLIICVSFWIVWNPSRNDEGWRVDWWLVAGSELESWVFAERSLWRSACSQGVCVADCLVGASFGWRFREGQPGLGAAQNTSEFTHNINVRFTYFCV